VTGDPLLVFMWSWSNYTMYFFFMWSWLQMVSLKLHNPNGGCFLFFFFLQNWTCLALSLVLFCLRNYGFWVCWCANDIKRVPWILFSRVHLILTAITVRAWSLITRMYSLIRILC
jgi:hypothetical protein